MFLWSFRPSRFPCSLSCLIVFILFFNTTTKMVSVRRRWWSDLGCPTWTGINPITYDKCDEDVVDDRTRLVIEERRRTEEWEVKEDCPWVDRFYRPFTVNVRVGVVTSFHPHPDALLSFYSWYPLFPLRICEVSTGYLYIMFLHV